MRIPNQSTSVVRTASALRLAVSIMPQQMTEQLRRIIIWTEPQKATCDGLSGGTCWVNSKGNCVCSDIVAEPPE